MADGDRRGWTDLPKDTRDLIDELICRRETFLAIRLVWQESGNDPRPSLPEAMDLVVERTDQLSQRGLVPPEPPPVTTAQLIERARAITDPVVAVEAWWDGDTFRWGVDLIAIVQRPSPRHPRFDEQRLAFVNGRDAPPFAGTGPRTPAAAEAMRKGLAVARSLGVPFHFFEPDAAHLDPPRWWDSQSAT